MLTQTSRKQSLAFVDTEGDGAVDKINLVSHAEFQTNA
jgi:hypothetical protein